MAEYVQYLKKDFNDLLKALSKEGFRVVTQKEEQQLFERLALSERPLKQRGSNIPLIYSRGRLSVKVSTTFDYKDKIAIKENRCAWVSLLDGDQRIFSSPQIRRTPGFIDKLIA